MAPAIREADLRRGYRLIPVKRTDFGELEAERLRPGLPSIGYHSCLDCVLAQIPDTSPRQLCHFCLRTRLRR